mgnify:CR=1 FL=1
MTENLRRCQYCNATVKDKALRCRTCGSIIGRKIPIIPSVPKENTENLEEDTCTIIAETQKNVKMSITVGGLFSFGLMVFVPVAGQIACFITGFVLLFYKNPEKKKKGKVYLFLSFLFFVLWFAVLYVLNQTFGWVELWH